MKLGILSGGRRHNGNSQGVANYIAEKAKALGHDVFLADAETFDLPVFENRFQDNPEFAAKFEEQIKWMTSADAYLWLTPEYNGGYSTALKNYIDVFSAGTFKQKAVGMITVSEGPGGGMRAALQLQNLVNAVFGIGLPNILTVPTVSQKFSKEGKLLDSEFEKKVDAFFQAYTWLAEALTLARKKNAK